MSRDDDHDGKPPTHDDDRVVTESGPAPREAPATFEADERTREAGRPSFFPHETVDQSRAFLDALQPSLPPSPALSADGDRDSGLFEVPGPLAHGDDGEISSVVLLPLHDAANLPRERGHAPGSRASAPPRAPLAAEQPAHARTGLLSSMLGEPAPAHDEGALAALRTLKRRKRRHTGGPLSSDDAEAVRLRAALCMHIADHSPAAAAARLHMLAAELHELQADRERARTNRAAAYQRNARDQVALRGRMQDLAAAADLTGLAEALRAESALPLAERERAHVLLTLAEVERESGEAAHADLRLREAGRQPEVTAAAALAGAELALARGRTLDAAEALRTAAELSADAPTRSGALTLAARLCERAGESVTAGELFARAREALPSGFGAILGSYRTCRAAGDFEGAAHALAELAERTTGALHDEAQRQRARLLHGPLGQPERALAVLASASQVPGLRLKARVAEAVSDDQARLSALHAWSHAALGTERSLPLLEAAQLHLRAGEHAAAEQALALAARASAPRGLLGVARSTLARALGSTHDLARAVVDEDADAALRSAAKLGRDPLQTQHELEVLRTASAAFASSTSAEVLLLDAAAECADLDTLESALRGRALGAPKAVRSGATLAWLDVVGGDVRDARVREALEALGESERTRLALRKLAASTEDAATRAALWLEEAAQSSGEPAAFAATMAGHVLQDAGADPIEAYVEALDLVRGYPPACIGLEVTARHRGDLLALERALREQALTSASSHERALQCARLGLLSAETDELAAVHWLSRANTERNGDVLLTELGLRLSVERGSRARGDALRAAAGLDDMSPFARALRLQAAAAYEDAFAWDEAIALYEGLLEQAPDDALANVALEQALRLSGRHAESSARIQATLLRVTTLAARSATLETLAEVEEARQEPGLARVALETLIEADPGHIPALRSLLRLAMNDADPVRMLPIAARLAEHLDNEPERAAALRLALRCARSIADDSHDELLLNARVTKDLTHALALEAHALSRGERTVFYEAARSVSELLTEPLERASYALRAAEAFEAAAPGRAARELRDALLCAAEHPLTLEELGRLHKAAGDARAAADTFVRAAGHAKGRQRRIPLLATAATIYQDELGDHALARETLLRVAELDVLYGDVFSRLRGLLASEGADEALLTLLDRRLAAPAEPSLRAQLQSERAQLLTRLQRPQDAIVALRAALAVDARRPAELRALASLCLDAGEYREAADALIALARDSTDPAVLGRAFLELGVLYDEHLPDARRAEIAFTRAVALSPDDPVPVEHLAELFARTHQLERALRARRHLVDMTRDEAQKQAFVIKLAALLARTDDERGAEALLEQARKQAPASLPVLRALSELYEGQHDAQAIAMHRMRSCHALRAAIEERPGDETLYQGLSELLRARGREDGGAQVADAARAVGLTLDSDAAAAAVTGLGARGLADQVRRRIEVKGAFEAARPVLRLLARELDSLLPCEALASAVQLDQPNDRVVSAVRELFGLQELRVLCGPVGIAIPVNATPLTLLVDQATFEHGSDAERFFLLVRAVAVARHDLTLLVRAAPERLLLLVHALKKLEQPTHALAAIDQDALAQLTTELRTALPEGVRTRLPPLLTELFAAGDPNPRRAVAHALDFGARTALCVTGNLRAAFDALLRLRGRDPRELTPEERAQAVRSDPQLRALLSFAVSETYLDVRREMLVPSARRTD